MDKTDKDYLDGSDDQLDARKAELERRAALEPDIQQSQLLTDAALECLDRKTKNQILRNQLAASGVAVRPPSGADLGLLREAFQDLSQQIATNQTVAATLTLATAVLKAAGEIADNIKARNA